MFIRLHMLLAPFENIVNLLWSILEGQSSQNRDTSVHHVCLKQVNISKKLFKRKFEIFKNKKEEKEYIRNYLIYDFVL